jgi:hypothetical protein
MTWQSREQGKGLSPKEKKWIAGAEKTLESRRESRDGDEEHSYGDSKALEARLDQIKRTRENQRSAWDLVEGVPPGFGG